MSDKKICPIMAKGWLSSKNGPRWKSTVADADRTLTFSMENLPPCFEERCGCWVKTSGLILGHCGLIGECKCV